MKSRRSLLQALPLLFLLVAPVRASQAENEKKPDRAALIAVARELMTTVRYCALVTIDARGRPQVRTMDSFPPDEHMVVWLGTNPKSRKVREIRKNSRVALYYFDAVSEGYVSISGISRIVTDPKEKARHWKEEWKGFYLDRDKGYVLIEIKPTKLEVVIVKKGIIGDPKTWKPPTVRF
jgi:general stress protein 26